MILSGWGNYPRLNTRFSTPDSPAAATAFVRKLAADQSCTIGRGAGRAYGDAAIGSDLTTSSFRLSRMIDFDESTGLLNAEAGVRLHQIIDTFLPRGFFPPVVPGTSFVTLGGMAAANVHGKNHHKHGGIASFIDSLTLVGADGQPIVCSRTENQVQFWATLGGMGLTGLITSVRLQLRRVQTDHVVQRTIVAPCLDAVLAALATYKDSTYSVAWIDGTATGASLGRSLLFLGEHATMEDIPQTLRQQPFGWRPGRGRALPVDLPEIVLNPLTIKAFNAMYFAKGVRAPESAILPWKPYFFPLDAIDGWNRLYGRRGFLQHQFVVPKAAGRDALGEVLERVAARASASFLAVLKLMGPDDCGWMSFPLEGYTLALDFPVSEANLSLLDELDACVVRYGGRLYLAKDARQSRRTLEAGYPALDAFRSLRRDLGADRAFSSALSSRLEL